MYYLSYFIIENSTNNYIFVIEISSKNPLTAVNGRFSGGLLNHGIE
jgi:hypothetical protein